MKTSFYSKEELQEIGFKAIGVNVCISRKISIYKPEVIAIGNNVRVDDFCILSGGIGISLGNYIHISPYSAIYGTAGVVMEDYTGLSPRCTLLSASDDFSGNSMVHPFFPDDLKSGFIPGEIKLKKFVQIGVCSTILPNVELQEGVAIGAHSLVTKPCEAWGIYAGVPAIRIKERSRKLLELERRFLEMQESK